MISIYVDEVLTNDTTVTSLTTNIAPMLADLRTENSEEDYNADDITIVYRTADISPEYIKGSKKARTETYTVELDVWARTFTNAVTTSIACRSALETGAPTIIDGIKVVSCLLTGGSSQGTEDGFFVYTHTYSIKIRF